MKKDLIFAPLLLLAGVALFLLRLTGMKAHIAVSVIGILLLAAYTVLTKREWKLPALEIGFRACYGVALISGVLLMKIHGVLFLSILHKACAALFVVALAASLIYKAASARRS